MSKWLWKVGTGKSATVSTSSWNDFSLLLSNPPSADAVNAVAFVTCTVFLYFVVVNPDVPASIAVFKPVNTSLKPIDENTSIDEVNTSRKLRTSLIENILGYSEKDKVEDLIRETIAIIKRKK